MKTSIFLFVVLLWGNVHASESERGFPPKMEAQQVSGEDKQFVYAEFMYQYFSFTQEEKFILSGLTVDGRLAATVGKSRSIVEALDLIGAEGWEMVSTITRNFDGGFEHHFYFKREIISEE